MKCRSGVIAPAGSPVSCVNVCVRERRRNCDTSVTDCLCCLMRDSLKKCFVNKGTFVL